MSYLIKPENRPNQRIETENELEEAEQLLAMNGEEYEVEELNGATAKDASDAPQTASQESQEAEVVEVENDAQPKADDIDGKPAVQDDPVDWLPDHFIDHIQGVTNSTL